MQTSTVPAEHFLAPQKLSQREARTEQLVCWSRKSIPERLAAATALTRRLYETRGIAYDEPEADFAPRRVRCRRS